MVRLTSGIAASLVLLAVVGLLFLLVAAPPLAFLALWLACEIRGLFHLRKRTFLDFEPDAFDAARLESAREEAADIVATIADIEAGKTTAGEDEADRLLDRYRALRSEMAALREQPPRAMRRWSSARAAASACRSGLVGIPLACGLGLLLFDPGLAPYRIVSAACAGWIVLAVPPLYWLRRRMFENRLGDRELFLERWSPEDDFLDFYLERADRMAAEQAARAEAGTGGETGQSETEAPHEAGRATPAERPKRPWHEVLEVPQDAGAAAIKRAFHQRIAQYHPDKVNHLGRELKELAAVITLEITEAYREAGKSRPQVTP